MLTRRPRAGDVINVMGREFVVGFATDDGLVRSDRGTAMLIWRFTDGSLNSVAVIGAEGPDVEDPRSHLKLLHEGTLAPERV